jgi:hypothetical protein
MVRLLGRISDSRIYFQDSKTIIDHGTTVSVGATGSQWVATHQKSVIWGWLAVRGAAGNLGNASSFWINASAGRSIQIQEGISSPSGITLDWYAIGYTS